MTYRAKIQDGQVVFEGGLKPVEGTELRVEIVEQPASTDASPAPDRATVVQRMLVFAGIMDDPGLPEDGSYNHDHYIYGAPKK